MLILNVILLAAIGIVAEDSSLKSSKSKHKLLIQMWSVSPTNLFITVFCSEHMNGDTNVLTVVHDGHGVI